MKVLFIYSLQDIVSAKKPMRAHLIPFGISYISSFLKKHGHLTKVIVLSRLLGKKNFIIINKYLGGFHPDIICFTSVATEHPFIETMASYIHKHFPDIYLMIGGPHASLNPQEIMVRGNFDALCIGEGEQPTLELILQLEQGKQPSAIPNLWIKNKSQLEMNSTRPFLQNLDILPFPDRDIWKEWLFKNPHGKQTVLLGRGCPHKCTYCSNSALSKLASGTYVRFRSSKNILQEIQEVLGDFPETKDIYFEVETIGAKKKWAFELCSKLEEFNSNLSNPISFGVNLRITPNADYQDLFIALKRSNFRYINIGVESGSDRVRREILKRNYSSNDIINISHLAKKYGLQLNIYNLVGVPGETIDDYNETIKINRLCQPDNNYNSIFYPYPGTQLYTLCNEKGLINKFHDEDIERTKATLDLPGFRKEQIQKGYVWFDYYVYKGYKPLFWLLYKVLRAKIRVNPFLTYLMRRFSYTFSFPWV